MISHYCRTCCITADFHIFCTERKSAVGDDWLCVVPNGRNKERLVLDVCFFALFAPATSLSTQLLVVTIGQKKSHKRRKTAANIDTFPVFLCSSNPFLPCCNSVQPQDCCFCLSASYFDKLLEKTIRHSPLVQQKCKQIQRKKKCGNLCSYIACLKTIK